MKKSFFYFLLLIFICLAGNPLFAQDERSISNEAVDAGTFNQSFGTQLGTVHFPVSCNKKAREAATLGLTLLHHMTYEGARGAFVTAIEADPDCAMGYWGKAMSFIHPVWSDQPSETEFAQGLSAIKNAKARGQKSMWEQAYIQAVEAYYAEGRRTNEEANLAGFEKAWQKVYNQFPEDNEAASFYALVYMATADKENQLYEKQKRAAEIAQKVLDRNPKHPGAHHYIIHAYDYPSLAEKALPVARRYGGIAPDVPHAVHMPSHIFTRLGLWQESITMNQRAATAALAHPAGEAVSLHYFHALDYLIYAFLQRAEDKNAKQVMSKIQSLNMPVQVHSATAYAFAAIPARFFLERQQWAEAAALEPRWPDNFPWDQFPAMEAITYFACALGAARSGNETRARRALDELKRLQKVVKGTSESWAQQIEIERLSAKAWLVFNEGQQKAALKLMHKAVALEATTEKHPVTPGAILTARELLADMYFEMDQYQDAQKNYLTELNHSPNRFNSLYGVARTAELSGDKVKAVSYYKKLVTMAALDATRARLQYARNFLENYALFGKRKRFAMERDR